MPGPRRGLPDTHNTPPARGQQPRRQGDQVRVVLLHRPLRGPGGRDRRRIQDDHVELRPVGPLPLQVAPGVGGLEAVAIAFEIQAGQAEVLPRPGQHAARQVDAGHGGGPRPRRGHRQRSGVRERVQHPAAGSEAPDVAPVLAHVGEQPDVQRAAQVDLVGNAQLVHHQLRRRFLPDELLLGRAILGILAAHLHHRALQPSPLRPSQRRLGQQPAHRQQALARHRDTT